MNKKAFIILGILLAAIIGLSAYLFIGRNKPAQENNPPRTEDTSNENIPDNGSKEPVKLSDVPVVAPALSYDGKAVWFFTADGHLYKVDLISGLKKEFLLPALLAVDQVIWPQEGNDFIVSSGTPGNKVFDYYSGEQKKYIRYPANIKGVDFLPDAKRVIYNWVGDDGKSELTEANPDAGAHQKLMDLIEGGFTIKVSPNGSKAFAFKEATPKDGKLNFIDLASKKTFVIKTSAVNSAAWSSNSKNFVFNKLDAGNSESRMLWIGSTESASADRSLGINASADRVVFDRSGEHMYVSSDEGLLWMVNTSTYEKTQVTIPGQTTLNAVNLLLSPDSGVLYYKAADGYLYSLDLRS